MATEQGLSLADIGAPHEQVSIGDQKLDVYGLSVESLIELLQRFPEIGKWLAPGVVDMKEMLVACPKVVRAIIASSTGTPGDMKVEDVAAKLSIEVQLDILEATIRLTFKDGFGPFVQRIAVLASIAESVNFGRVMATNLQPPSKPSSPLDTTPSPSGS